MAIPFYAPGIPGDMIAMWFSRFFQPGLISVMTLGVTTLVTGLRAWRGLEPSASRHAALGLLFTVVHFGFGPLVSSLCVGLVKHGLTFYLDYVMYGSDVGGF